MMILFSRPPRKAWCIWVFEVPVSEQTKNIGVYMSSYPLTLSSKWRPNMFFDANLNSKGHLNIKYKCSWGCSPSQ